jgi:hypothetical protein
MLLFLKTQLRHLRRRTQLRAACHICNVQSNNSDPFIVRKTGPTTVRARQAFEYNVTVIFQGNATGMEVVDVLPPFLSASSNGSSWRSVTATGQGPSGGKLQPLLLWTACSNQQIAGVCMTLCIDGSIAVCSYSHCQNVTEPKH